MSEDSFANLYFTEWKHFRAGKIYIIWEKYDEEAQIQKSETLLIQRNNKWI